MTLLQSMRCLPRRSEALDNRTKLVQAYVHKNAEYAVFTAATSWSAAAEGNMNDRMNQAQSECVLPRLWQQMHARVNRAHCCASLPHHAVHTYTKLHLHQPSLFVLKLSLHSAMSSSRPIEPQIIDGYLGLHGQDRGECLLQAASLATAVQLQVLDGHRWHVALWGNVASQWRHHWHHCLLQAALA